MTIASDNILDNIPENVDNIAFTAKMGRRVRHVVVDIYDNEDGTFDVNSGTLGGPNDVQTFASLSYEGARNKLVEIVATYTFVHSISNVSYGTAE